MGGDEASAPITSVAVSHRQQYLAVLRRDEPLELWDLATLRPLSTPAAYTSIAAMEWSAWAGHRKRDEPAPAGRGPSEEELILHMSDGASASATVTFAAAGGRALKPTWLEALCTLAQVLLFTAWSRTAPSSKSASLA